MENNFTIIVFGEVQLPFSVWTVELCKWRMNGKNSYVNIVYIYLKKIIRKKGFY